MESFALLLKGASSLSASFDLLFISLLVLCSVVALSITFLIVFFAIKYRRGSKAKRARIRGARAIEFAWTFIPLGLFLVIFVWAAKLYTELFRPPQKEAIEIAVVGKQWMWKLKHPEGKQEINELHVPYGSTVQLTMISQDVIHSFFVPAFRIKHDVLPGRYTRIWFRPIKTGEYYLFCAEYCGMDHSRMGGRIVVMEPSAYEQWLQQ
ncbi:cytochrome c oxidase, subunit II [Nitrosococcus halophilus Nc 4]|uniref:cytochrome-c oxidase n=1 Tax=Nitrosococcus halophilus (strain Nc4) TaxID=472759 RepID=D5BWM9_NITHN|nr:cytochrome c oxidase subunit II [Nitrosococcus halophilus]ADE15686.1 cytochrome c oxidase, subunit II [Nitrosococcus halophilus Nc 4]